MFIEIHFPEELPVDRDEIEDALIEALDGVGEVTGAGTGEYGSNLDVELLPATPRDDGLALVARTVEEAAPGVTARLRPEDTGEWINLHDLL